MSLMPGPFKNVLISEASELYSGYTLFSVLVRVLTDVTQALDSLACLLQMICWECLQVRHCFCVPSHIYHVITW